MATIKVVDVLGRASVLLQDTDQTRFSNANLLKFFNDAQREVALQRPDAFMTNGNFTCATGSKQTLPSGGIRLLDVVRNVSGRAITAIDRKVLDEQLPTWHTTASSNDGIQHFVYDPIDPKTFYVYPNATNSTQIEIKYSQSPDDVAITNFSTDTQVLDLDDVYANALLDYVMYRSYQFDSEFAGDDQKAGQFYQTFLASIGAKSRADAGTIPVPANQGAQ